MSVQVMSAPADPTAGSTADAVRGHQNTVLSALLNRCAQRDQAALAQFYELTSPWVYTLVRRRTTSAAEADDAAVTVYAKAWRRSADFATAERSALAWITSIVFEGSARRHHRSGSIPS